MIATGFDVFGLLLILVMAMSGLKKGLIDGVFKIVGVYAAIYASMNYNHYGTLFLQPLIHIPEAYQTTAGFIVVFLVVMYSFSLAAWILRKMVDTLKLGALDRFGGITFGAAKAGLVLSAVVWAFQIIPTDMRGEYLKESKLYPVVEIFAAQVVDLFSLEDELAMLQETVGSIMGRGKEQVLEAALTQGGLGEMGLDMDAITKVGAAGSLSADGKSIIPDQLSQSLDLQSGELLKNPALLKAMESLDAPQKQIIEEAIKALQTGDANSMLEGALKSKDASGNSLMDAAMNYMDPAQKASLNDLIKQLDSEIQSQRSE